MKRIPVLLLFFCCASVLAENALAAPPRQDASLASLASSAQMEKDLQRLDWRQFRSVVEAIPKLKADVEAYGPAGWEFVRANYRSYRWKKNIDRLDASQKEELAALIEKAKAIPHTPHPPPTAQGKTARQ